MDTGLLRTEALRAVVAFDPRNPSAHRPTERVGFCGHRSDREGEIVAHIERVGWRQFKA